MTKSSHVETADQQTKRIDQQDARMTQLGPQPDHSQAKRTKITGGL